MCTEVAVKYQSLFIFSKLLEISVFDEVMKCLVEKIYFMNTNMNFPPKYSAIYSIIHIRTSVSKPVPEFTLGVLHDDPKVFDAISHGILPKYLNNYDILWKAYDWFRNIHCLWLLLQTRYTSQSDLNELYANVNVKVNELY